MQEKSYISLEPDYDDGMSAGRPAKNKRSPFGERLAHVRQEAGLSQQQLADKLGTTQRVMAYWERSQVALRADQLTALANTLGVTADFLLGRETTKKRGNGPIGRAKRLFDAVSLLPRHQQEKIFSILDPYIAQHTRDLSHLRVVEQASAIERNKTQVG